MRILSVIFMLFMATAALAHPHHECHPGDLHCDKEHNSGKEQGK
jgi:hypothetical protein